MVSYLFSYAFKDLFRQKTRTYLGIFGIGISLFLLTTVSFITDSVSYSYIDFLTVDSGNQDFNIQVRHYNDEIENRSDYFDFQSLSTKIKSEIDEIENIIPRYSDYGLYNGTISHPNDNVKGVNLYALDIQLEEEINFGSFTNLDQDFSLQNGIPVNSCIIDSNYAKDINVNIGDIIEIYLFNFNSTVNLTVESTYVPVLKFPAGHRCDVIVDLSWWGTTGNQVYNGFDFDFNWENKTNNLILTLKDSQNIYDIRDIEGTEKIIVDIGAKIQMSIGLEAWDIDYPKLNNLFEAEMFSLGMNILFVIIGFISMLISGILINGILSTSVEERIREYGINRVLGARKSYNIKLVFIQALIIIFLGTSLGIISASVFVSQGAIPLIETLTADDYMLNITFVAKISSIFMSFIIGIGVSLIVSIAPALKVMRMQIVESINPYRHSEELYSIKKEGSPNVRLIVIGIFIAVNGGIVFFLLPKLILSLQFTLFATILIATLLSFLIGVSLTAVGLIPLLLRILIKIVEPFAQKSISIIKITVFRHQRRNLSTIIMFILSFSFILFTTTMIEIQVKQVGGIRAYNNGSDIILRPRTYDIEAPTVKFESIIESIEGIERTSSLLASPSDLQNIYHEENKGFSVRMGDYIDLTSTNIRLYGIDNKFKETISTNMKEHLVFASGDEDIAFKDLFTENSGEINIIISSMVASQLQIRKDDKARLTFTRGTEEAPFICKVVGVLKNSPGLSRIREAGIGGGGTGGVLISHKNYNKCFNIPDGENAYVDKIFIKVKEGYDHNLVYKEILSHIDSDKIYAELTIEEIIEAEGNFKTIQYFFLLIQSGTIGIAIFGLISSAYSSILERSREIAIIRTLGLHGSEVEKMFLLENFLLLLASSTAGGTIGILMAYGLSEDMTLFTQTPQMISLPWSIIIIIYAFSIISLYFGMKWLMRKLRNKNLIEIFRETL